MEKYINRIIKICNEAKPSQKMMFDNFGKYILHIEKDAVKRNGKFKDLLVGDEVGIHMLDMYRVLKGIADGTRKLSTL